VSTVQEIGQKVQEQTLEAVRKTQDAAVDAVTAWAETANKVTPQMTDFVKGYEMPGYNGVTKDLPSAAEVIDSNFDFAQKILNSQREFAHRIVAATKQAAE
jgi:hypothetical protein